MNTWYSRGDSTPLLSVQLEQEMSTYIRNTKVICYNTPLLTIKLEMIAYIKNTIFICYITPLLSVELEMCTHIKNTKGTVGVRDEYLH